MKYSTKKVFVVSDPGLDPDDMLNAWLMVKLQKLGWLEVIGAIANYSPSSQRARLLKGVFNELGADIPVAIGTDCNSYHKPRDYEFSALMADSSELDRSDGWQRLEQQKDGSVSLLLISGLTDVYRAARKYPWLCRKLKEVYIMGGATWQDGKMIADLTASNNKFDATLNPQAVYDLFVSQYVPLNVLSRHAAYAAGVTPSFYGKLNQINRVGQHLYAIQKQAIDSLWQFACANPPEHRQNRSWFCKTFCGADDLPITVTDSPWPHVKKLAIYDPLTTLWMFFPELFRPEVRTINGVEHQIVGVSSESDGVVNGAKAIEKVLEILA